MNFKKVVQVGRRKKWGLGLVAVTLLLFGVVAQATAVTFWTTEVEPRRMAIQEEIARQFEALNPGINVEIVPVREVDLPARIIAAAAAGALPDAVFHPMDFTIGWAAEGILDVEAATSVINELGAETFAAGPLTMARFGEGWTAAPADGWGQLLVYRKDMFEEKGLAVPDTWDAILTAAKALHNPPLMWGFGLGNDPAEVYTQQVFEGFALSNNARLIDVEGNVNLNTPEFIRTLTFYKQLQEYSPPGLIHWMHTRLDYFANRVAMIVWSPFIMDELAGLRFGVPPILPDLPERTGFVTRIKGPDGPEGGVQYGQVSYFGITVDADTDAAKLFVRYLLTDGYLDWLSMAPEGKFPLQPAFLEGWGKLEFGVDVRKSILEVYPPEVVQIIVEGVEGFDRWGFAAGKGALIAKIYGTRIVPEVIRLYLDGEVAAGHAAELLTSRIRAMLVE